LGPRDPVQGGGDVQKLAADFEVDALKNGVGGGSRGHGRVPRLLTQISRGGTNSSVSPPRPGKSSASARPSSGRSVNRCAAVFRCAGGSIFADFAGATARL